MTAKTTTAPAAHPRHTTPDEFPATHPRATTLDEFPAAPRSGQDHIEDPRTTTAHHTTPARR
ncbi:hypothetical protein J7F04_39455 [Streptomyces sp. ISL-24]|uniref:hypothetical protein n=1 Tax=Streptomyces sp. ISL-24 TaxID=2819181 RepID=UPI001BE9A93F|nr:hypothetical protein [Streptomyces sp. ISL-24]MBT2423729.1 hypothetical protein [Streptomyces sp. ISL-24]